MKKPLPWHDAIWLRQYLLAREIVGRVRPALLPDFLRAFEPFKTRSDYELKHLRRVFDDATMQEISRAIRSLQTEKVKRHELQSLGRLVVHAHPYFTQLQHQLTPLIASLVGEEVEPSYNFLSLYTKFGVCPIHMDAPRAKWTLDICIEQSEPWPIHFSQVIPWQEDFTYEDGDWQEQVKRSRDLRFTARTLQPGEALLFSGSAQWHYREPLAPASGQGSCKLLFFHYIPAGTNELAAPGKWARIFGVPELAEVENVS